MCRTGCLHRWRRECTQRQIAVDRNECDCYPEGTVDGRKCTDSVCQCRPLVDTDVAAAGPKCVSWLLPRYLLHRLSRILPLLLCYFIISLSSSSSSSFYSFSLFPGQAELICVLLCVITNHKLLDLFCASVPAINKIYIFPLTPQLTNPIIRICISLISNHHNHDMRANKTVE